MFDINRCWNYAGAARRANSLLALKNCGRAVGVAVGRLRCFVLLIGQRNEVFSCGSINIVGNVYGN